MNTLDDETFAPGTRKARVEIIPLIDVIFNPANYYSRFICLLPLLGVELARKPRSW